MGEKREQYDNLVGKFHLAKESVKEKWSNYKDAGDGAFKDKANEIKEDVISKINRGDIEYDHLYR